MDIDFSLVLLVLVVLTGAVALFDRLVNAEPRRQAVARPSTGSARSSQRRRSTSGASASLFT